MERRRLIEYGGIIKTEHKELNLVDDTNSDNVDLVHSNADSDNKGVENFIRIEDKEG